MIWNYVTVKELLVLTGLGLGVAAFSACQPTDEPPPSLPTEVQADPPAYQAAGDEEPTELVHAHAY